MKTNRYDEITFVLETVWGEKDGIYYADALDLRVKDIGEQIEAFVKSLPCERRGTVDNYGQIKITVERRFSPNEAILYNMGKEDA